MKGDQHFWLQQIKQVTALSFDNEAAKYVTIIIVHYSLPTPLITANARSARLFMQDSNVVYNGKWKSKLYLRFYLSKKGCKLPCYND